MNGPEPKENVTVNLAVVVVCGRWRLLWTGYHERSSRHRTGPLHPPSTAHAIVFRSIRFDDN